MPTPRQGYFLKDGTQVPSVTTVLGILQLGSSDALCHWAAKLATQGERWMDVRDRSATLGTYIHDLLDHYPDPLPATAPAWMTPEEWTKARRDFEDFAAWDARVMPRVIAHEIQCTSEALRVGGTFDQIVQLPGLHADGAVAVLDFKTGKHVDPVKVPCQLAAYGALALEAGIVKEPIRRGLILHFGPKGLRPLEVDAERMAAGLELFKAARRTYDLIKGFPK